MSARYVQGGSAGGYRPTAGSGLTLDIGGGTAYCGNVAIAYSAGTLTMAASSTNYVYLDGTSSCAPASNTTGFSATTIPIATVTTSGSAITGISDDRTMFFLGGTGTGGAGAAIPVSQGCLTPSLFSGTSGTCEFQSTVTSGQLIAGQVSWYSTAATVTMTDSCGSILATKPPTVSTNWYQANFSGTAACTGNDTITATFNTSITGDGQITAVSFNLFGATLDCQPGTTGTGSSTSLVSNPCVTTNASDILVGLGTQAAFNGFSVGSNGQGGTYSYLLGESSAYLGVLSYMGVSSIASYSAAFTAGGSANWNAQMMAFRNPGATSKPLNSCFDNPGGRTSQCTLYGVSPNHLLIVPAWGYSFNPAIFSDTFGLSWTAGVSCNAHRAGSDNDYLTYYWAYTGSHSGTENIEVSVASGGNSAMEAGEFQGMMVGSGPDGTDVCATGTTGSPGTISSGNMTTSNNGDLIVGIGMSISTALNPGSGFVLTTGVPLYAGGNVGPLVSETETQATAGSVAATETQIGADGFYIMLVTAFQQ